MAQPVEVGRLINLIPVGLKEAAIDSPTSRASIHHFSEQVDLLEKWLEEYLKGTNRLVAESTTLETIVNTFTSLAVVPTAVSETMLDHDYTVLAMRKYSEGSKDFWMSMVTVMKRLSTLVCIPIRQFQSHDISAFKDARRAVEHHMKVFDELQGKYMGQGKSKEPSSLREDAFQLHEARRTYLKSQMDFFELAPQFRFALDKLLVRIFHDQWIELRQARDNTTTTFQKNEQEMERVRGWLREMEDSENSFRKELVAARKELEEAAELSMRPSRELDEYNASTVSTIGKHTRNTSGNTAPKTPIRAPVRNAEKQGWLYLRTYGGKPTRTIWVKRWAFVRDGVFGWLVQDPRSGGVEESERIGVLLCAVRPASSEERRFCFELKTTKNTIVLQTETQGGLASWIAAFEAAKTKAVESPGSGDALASFSRPNSDPAFTISPPPIAEFGTSVLASTERGVVEDSLTIDRTNTLPTPTADTARESFDVRRGAGAEDSTKDHTSRIMSKLDIHKRNPTAPQVSPSPSISGPAGGIASLIAASHGSMPVGPSLPMVQGHAEDKPQKKLQFTLALRDMPPSTLAPSTLANVPTPTSLSKTAVVISGERGIRGTTTDRYGIPNGILANTWGSSNSSFVNRFDRSELRVVSEGRVPPQPSPMMSPVAPSPRKPGLPQEGSDLSTLSAMELPSSTLAFRSRTPSPSKRHRNTISIDKVESRRERFDVGLPDYPNYYPLQLKTQDAQFRLLFPNVRRNERLVMAFRGTWNPNGSQDFPGRIYVTAKEMYFYSNHLGLVLTSGVSLASVDEVTAAPGKECDFIFVHLKETALSGSSRVTIKTFVEPLKLLQRRLNFLVKNCQADEPLGLEEIIKSLLTMEIDRRGRSGSVDSWEDVSLNTPVDGGTRFRSQSMLATNDLKSPIRVDRSLFSNHASQGEQSSKFKLPAKPVRYSPPGYSALPVEREYDVSPKALFHVMFGDNSALWQLLQHERNAKNLKQGPWVPLGEGRLFRDFQFNVPTTNIFGQPVMSEVKDFQVIDVSSDHLCYVVTDKRTPWHLPFQKSYRLVSKIVITHVAKSKCKLAVFVRVEWLSDPWMMKNALDRQALHDLSLDAQDLADLVSDQVRKLGAYSRTKKAVQIFGQVGQSTQATQLAIGSSPLNIGMRRQPVQRSLTGLLVQDIGSATQTWLGTILQAVLNMGTWMVKVCNAHTFILILLVGSALYNGWFVTRDGYEWWHERKTANFMKRIGIAPDRVMKKAVYVNDLDVAMSTVGTVPSRDTSVCYSAFYDDYYLDDVEAPLAGIPSLSASSSSSLRVQPRRGSLVAARKLQTARQRLGTYRHDVLVAMRVVNTIERELIQGDWERWLTEENRKCRQVGSLITGRDNQTAPDVGKKGRHTSGKGSGNDGDNQQIDRWYQEYCTSCRAEHDQRGSVV